MKLKTIIQQYVKENSTQGLGANLHRGKLEHSTASPLPLTESGTTLYDDNASMFANNFTQFKDWFKQTGGKVKVYKGSDNLKLFVGFKNGQQVWTWSPEDDKLFFDRKDAFAFSKFFNK